MKAAKHDPAPLPRHRLVSTVEMVVYRTERVHDGRNPVWEVEASTVLNPAMDRSPGVRWTVPLMEPAPRPGHRVRVTIETVDE